MPRRAAGAQRLRESLVALAAQSWHLGARLPDTSAVTDAGAGPVECSRPGARCCYLSWRPALAEIIGDGRPWRANAHAELIKGARNPIPALLLGRLAVDRNYANLGVGTALTLHVLATAVELNEKAACRAAVVGAINPNALRVVGATRVPSLPPRRQRRARPLPADIGNPGDPAKAQIAEGISSTQSWHLGLWSGIRPLR